MNISLLREYQSSVKKELEDNILSFWMKYTLDEENGGFYGVISNSLEVEKKVDKGCILNARILWTYSAAYRHLKDPKYLEIAKRAYHYFIRHFWDSEYQGVFWMLDYKGCPVNSRKQIYAQAFGIYALSEYYMITGEQESIDYAIKLFELIEKYSYDAEYGGYLEAFTKEWVIESDLRLSDKDMNVKKSMNTHLHVLEAYTNLLRVWEDTILREKLIDLIHITIDKIVDPLSYHFKLFFDENWKSKSEHISYGHDIEGSWLLAEAAEVTGDAGIIQKAKEVAIKMAQVVYEQGVDQDGGLLNEADSAGIIDSDKDWWPQAEGAVGFLNAYEMTLDESFLEASYNVWDFINKFIVDKENGEWFWKVDRAGNVCYEEPKVSAWKCPYHNGRACFEICERLARLDGNI